MACSALERSLAAHLLSYSVSCAVAALLVVALLHHEHHTGFMPSRLDVPAQREAGDAQRGRRDRLRHPLQRALQLRRAARLRRLPAAEAAHPHGQRHGRSSQVKFASRLLMENHMGAINAGVLMRNMYRAHHDMGCSRENPVRLATRFDASPTIERDLNPNPQNLTQTPTQC